MLNDTEIVTCAQMRAIESAAISSGEVTGAELIERASAAVAGQIRLRWPKPGKATVLCGPGNNGGDGYVVARHLHLAGWRVRVFATDPAPCSDAAAMRSAWTAIASVEPLTPDALRQPADIVVDALLGTGLSRSPRGKIAQVLAALSGCDAPIIAVDGPSGLCLDSGRPLVSAPHATLTVTFHSPKPGHLLHAGPATCGKVVVADIGLSAWRRDQIARTAAMTPEITRWLSKQTLPDAHKFGHGHVLIVAGDAGQGGAARLSARAALRAGAGLVTLLPTTAAMPEHAQPPDALMRRAVDTPDDLAPLLDDARVTAICIGPGAGVDRATLLLPAILASSKPTLLDADAITAVARHDHLRRSLHDGCILTPHGGEFARLFPDLARRLSAPPETGPAYSRLNAAQRAAAVLGATVLLKGADTVVADAQGRAHIHSAHDVPWLATAGSGDVLAGIITALLARGRDALTAAAWGAAIHASAARHAGPGLIADDLPDAIAGMLRNPSHHPRSRPPCR